MQCLPMYIVWSTTISVILLSLCECCVQLLRQCEELIATIPVDGYSSSKNIITCISMHIT